MVLHLTLSLPSATIWHQPYTTRDSGVQLGSVEGKSLTVMYQSIPSLTILPGKTPGIFLNQRNPIPGAQRKVRNPDPRGKKVLLRPHPQAIMLKNPANTIKHKTKVVKSSTEMLICLKILKQ